MDDRRWTSPGAPSDEAALRNLVIEELWKVGACTVEECQQKSDNELKDLCEDDAQVIEEKWCDNCLATAKGFMPPPQGLSSVWDVTCANMNDNERVNTVIEILRKEGNDREQLQGRNYKELLATCNDASNFRNW